ncbi:uncharacterized protein A1O5_01151 [Cladophialophora psammophila CBS 110553]|uniref:Uncharacterized protein n=1 Tax=Cladophialophora psammophila CBS 110553 TaxID=1182543 RepID=W9X8S1_9EURO|nr:uncharacterized protein A1O5_01151 [Cladophialophora psammophila CBS 110553]EXJ76643.1 hypothetical protein A1O5_01151 [Cladophialophora psammophila CBS 110553]
MSFKNAYDRKPSRYLIKEVRGINCSFCDKALTTTNKFIAMPYQKWHFYDDFASEGSSALPLTLDLAITHSICNNSVAKVKQLLADGILAKTRHGSQALRLAAQHGNEVIVWLLIHHKFDLNEKDAVDNGKTALHYAAEAGHTPVVEMLLKAGSDPFVERTDSRSSISLAAEHGHSSTVRTLCEAYRERGRYHMEHLHRSWITAAEHGHSECLRALTSSFEEAHAEDCILSSETLAGWIFEGIETAIEKNTQESIQEITSHAWRPSSLPNQLRSDAAIRIIQWVWWSVKNSSLSHLTLSIPWLEHESLSTHLSPHGGLSDGVISDLSSTLLEEWHEKNRYYRLGLGEILETIEPGHLQRLLKQHPEFIQHQYLDLARRRRQGCLMYFLQKGLNPHPNTLQVLARFSHHDGLGSLVEQFSSHFPENDKTNALICAVKARNEDCINAFIKVRALPASTSVAADKLLLACVEKENWALIEELRNGPATLFSAAGIADAGSVADGLLLKYVKGTKLGRDYYDYTPALRRRHHENHTPELISRGAAWFSAYGIAAAKAAATDRKEALELLEAHFPSTNAVETSPSLTVSVQATAYGVGISHQHKASFVNGISEKDREYKFGASL